MHTRRRSFLAVSLVVLAGFALGGCQSDAPSRSSNLASNDPRVSPQGDVRTGRTVRTDARPRERVQWAIAIHGGAGVIDKSSSVELRAEHAKALADALEVGRDALAKGGTALDAVESVCRVLEEDPHFNAGVGSVYTADGTHELDASIMDGRTMGCGAVAGVTTVRNPISLARLVMEKSPHVLMARDGAEAFATSMGVERVSNSFFDTPKRRESFERWKSMQPRSDSTNARGNKRWAYGTVGAVALDKDGNLAAATSTGGMTGKRFGRVGDSPIIGAGTLAKNGVCAVSCTGTGEEFIRHGVARDISARMEYAGKSAQQAAKELVFDVLKPDDGGVIVVSSTGEIAMVYSSAGMFRGAADSTGRFDVSIWEQIERLPSATPTSTTKPMTTGTGRTAPPHAYEGGK